MPQYEYCVYFRPQIAGAHYAPNMKVHDFACTLRISAMTMTVSNDAKFAASEPEQTIITVCISSVYSQLHC